MQIHSAVCRWLQCSTPVMLTVFDLATMPAWESSRWLRSTPVMLTVFDLATMAAWESSHHERSYAIRSEQTWVLRSRYVL